MMGSLFDDRMNGLERAHASTDPAHAETETVKTYVLELTAHSLPDSKLRSALHEIFSTPPIRSVKALTATFATQDKLLHVSGRYHRKRIGAYVDFRDPRFLRLHSTAKSELLDDFVLGWTGKLPELDHAWFDDSFLDSCSKFGALRGIAVEYNNQPLASTDDEAEVDDEALESIRLRQSGKAQKMLDLLRKSNDFAQQSSLSMVRIKREEGTKSATAEIRFNGRITGRGSSFIQHTELAECIIERYRTRVLEVENGFSLSARGVGGGYRLTGQPIKVDMKPHIADLPAFCARLFSAINPFRLAGIPRRVGDDHFLVAAVDLHTGQTLRFELSPDRIIVFLPAGTCGNTLLRFVTNLQRHHSRLVRAPQLGWG